MPNTDRVFKMEFNRKKSVFEALSQGYMKKAEKKLADIAERKENIKKPVDRRVRVDHNEEYYDLIDTTVHDPDALELLRLKRLLNDSINTCESEVQEEVQKRLTIEKQEQFKSSHNTVRTDLNRTFSKTVLNTRRSPVKIPPVRQNTTRRISPLSSNKDSCVQVKSQSEPVLRKALNPNTCSCCDGHLTSDFKSKESFITKINKVLPPDLGMQRILNVATARSNTQYLNCAVQIEPPCRVKPLGTTYAQIMEPESSAKIELQKPSHICKSHINTRNNIGLINIIKENSPKKKLMVQTLPNIEISGRNSIKHRENVKVVTSIEPELLNDSSAMPSVSFEHQSSIIHEPLPKMQHCHPCFNPDLLASIATALNQQQKGHDHVNDFIDQNQIRNLFVNVLREEIPKALQVVSAGGTMENVQVGHLEKADTQTYHPNNMRPPSPIVAPAKCNLLEQSNFREENSQTTLDHSIGVLDFPRSVLDISQDVAEILTDEEKMRQSSSTPVADIVTEGISNKPKVLRPEVDSKHQINSNIDRVVRLQNNVCTKKDASTQFCPEKECQAVPEMREVSTQWPSSKCVTCGNNETEIIHSVDAEIQFPSVENSFDFENNAKDVGIQAENLDFSISSSSNSNENEFVDDLLSEGDMPLPWNLRLLSLVERKSVPINTKQPRKDSDHSLSEGELPPNYEPVYGAINSILHVRNSSESMNYSFSEGEIHPQFLAIKNCFNKTLHESSYFHNDCSCYTRIFDQDQSSSQGTLSGDSSDSKLVHSSFFTESSEESTSESLITTGHEQSRTKHSTELFTQLNEPNIVLPTGLKSNYLVRDSAIRVLPKNKSFKPSAIKYNASFATVNIFEDIYDKRSNVSKLPHLNTVTEESADAVMDSPPQRKIQLENVEMSAINIPQIVIEEDYDYQDCRFVARPLPVFPQEL